jgi:hypothetical protein
MAKASKDFKKVLQEAERQGWRVQPTPGGHWRLYAPDGEHIVHAASTPSDYRDLDNVVARMRRYGFTWKGR